MATSIEPGEVLFLDTSYAIALASSSDQFHLRALQLADAIEMAKVPLVTTRAVLLEIGNALARQRYRAAAVAILDALENDPTVEIIPISNDLSTRSMTLYRDRPDKEWGLIDCASFVAMSDRGIAKALTADEHFQQAGFRALLRNLDG